MSNAKAVSTIEPRQTTVVGYWDLIAKAADSGNLELVERMMALQERYEANEARKAFVASMAAAKAEFPVISKNRHVGFESKKVPGQRTDYDYEDLAGIAAAIDPILGKHGLFYRFRATAELNEPVTVSCIVEHALGHFIETPPLKGPRDTSGNKNDIQSVGSTITFLQRYALKAALGLAAASDDDGKSAGEPERAHMSDEQVRDLSDLLTTEGMSITLFLKKVNQESLTSIWSDKFDECVKLIKDTAAKNRERRADQFEKARSVEKA